MTGWFKKNFGSPDANRKAALNFVLLLGAISFFSDMTHEGARSITGPFLGSLGASATIVGIVAGFGEFVGYVLRLASGKLSDTTGRYWLITIWGYIINLVAVPLLALAGNWPVAALLMIMERAGRAIRNPARDVMLSSVAKNFGRGWAFGLHEALDQLGAMAGPLSISLILFLHGDYRTGFGALAIPVVLSLSILAAARIIYPRPVIVEEKGGQDGQGFSKKFWFYLAATSLVAIGYADFPLIAYQFERASSVPALWVPIFYAAAMGVSALAALVFGRRFDRSGLSVLAYATLASALFAPLVFLGNFYFALAGMVLWGLGMGAHESIMRAAVADMVPVSRRGYAYGMFNTVYGICWFLGSAALGFLADRSLPALIAFSVIAQLIAVPLFFSINKMR